MTIYDTSSGADSNQLALKHRYKSVNTIQNALPSPVRYIPLPEEIYLQGHLY